MPATHRTVTLLTAAALGLTLTAGAADDGSTVTETVDASGITVVSTTHERFMMLSPGETVSWYLDVTSEHQPAALGLRLMPTGEMDAELSIFDCTSSAECTAMISDRTFAAGDDLAVEGFTDTMNLRIDVAAGENLHESARMSLGALVTGTDASVAVGLPGTDTAPVVVPADPSAPGSQAGPVAQTPAEVGSGSSHQVPGAEAVTASPSGQTETGQADETSGAIVTAGTLLSSVANNVPYQDSSAGDSWTRPSTLSPVSEPAFRGILAATGENALVYAVLGLGLIGAGAAVIWRRKALSVTV